MTNKKSEESTVEQEVINAASEWVEDSNEPSKNPSSFPHLVLAEELMN
ncbi:MAG: hypothetical protein RLZZ240_852 [Actinomycetota bacterium]